jgi:uncharacterized protein YkwD
MKKFLGYICGISLFFGGVSNAITLESFTSAIDQQVEQQGSTEKKISFLEGLKSLLESPTFTTSEYYQMFAELANYSYQKIQTIKSTPDSTVRWQTKPSDGKSYLTLSNVNLQTVRDTLLGWHNDERISLGLSPYAYHSDLEKSATTWAEVLKNEERTSNTHSRSSSDGYYNYESIMDRFGGLNIFFPSATNGRASFSESVGWGYYKCSSSDCTDTLITQLKTTRDFFMSEKKSNGSHYRAITTSHFTQMGIGVVIDSSKNRYYMVIHYGMDVIELG